MKVILVPSYLTNEELESKGIKPTATVEAEYGDKVIRGEQVTLAHHTKEFCHNPAPCNTENVPVLDDDATIVVSHIDLDTLGGIAALMGRKPNDKRFWQAAEYIDLHGYHHLFEIPEDVRKKYVAFCAYDQQHRGTRTMEPTDVTESVIERLDVIDNVILGDKLLIELGSIWEKLQTDEIESCLLRENDNIRIFDSKNGIFCNAEYYSPNQGKVIPCTISLNGKFKAVTIAFEDGGKKLNAKDLVQKLWGPEAGGHPGIAGSPRGKEMTMNDVMELAVATEEAYEKANKREEKDEESI